MLLRKSQLIGIGARNANQDNGTQVFFRTANHPRFWDSPNRGQVLHQRLRKIERELVLLQVRVGIKQSKLDLDVLRISIQRGFEVMAGKLRLAFVKIGTTDRGKHVYGKFIRLRQVGFELFNSLGRTQTVRECDHAVEQQALSNRRCEVAARK